MNEETTFVVFEDVVVPESVLLKLEREQGYGKVAGLADEELADPDELERQVVREELGPILSLPRKRKHGFFRQDVDEDGFAYGAFATVDFDRGRPGFDKARYKAEKLREELRNVVIMIDMIRRRLPRKKAAMVLKEVKMGVLDADDIEHMDMWQLAKKWQRARWIRGQIVDLEEASFRRKQKQTEAFLRA